MKVIQKIHQTISLLAIGFLINACAIDNDIPYPIVEGAIEAMEVDGQCDANGNSSTAATINKKEKTVKLYIDDTVNKHALRITKLVVSNNATYRLADMSVCQDAERFPSVGFNTLNDIPINANTKINSSKPLHFILHTYQDYEWAVNIEQIIQREVLLANQIGDAVIDTLNRTAVIYVSTAQPLNKIKVNNFKLGGTHGRVVPDPTDLTYDFSSPQQFLVSHGWEQTSKRYTVYVYQKEETVSLTANHFAMATRAYLDGTMISGKTPVVEYKKKSESNWTAVPSGDMTLMGTKYNCIIKGLKPGTDYEYRITVDNETGEAQNFTTAPATPLPNGSMDDWHQEGKLWNPWANGTESYWDTGNRGATTVGDSNSIPTDETSTGSGKAAYLQSKYIVIKFAAGNIFTGSYLETTGTNGVLGFGRPFTSFPTGLKFSYKFKGSTINRVGDDEYQHLKGQPDSCQVYIALTDWDEPLVIRTRPSERSLFDRNDPKVIAYAELTQADDVPQWTEMKLQLNYRYTNRTPKYILVVASSSKYGDFFTGGENSQMWLDNLELIYE